MLRTAALWSALLLALAPAACGPGDDRADTATDVGRDVPADAADLPLPDPGSDVAAPDEGGEDAPPTCASVLVDWQCLAGTDCPEWQDCTGPEKCYSPPCWGDFCTDFPGVCQGRVAGRACPGLTGCDAGQGCAGTVAGDLGACRVLPVPSGACWEDGDCKGAQRCTGEVRCDPTRIATCVEHPGLCLPPSASGTCLDDDECPAGSWCKGATLCAVGNAGCTDLAGTCEAGARHSCQEVADCSDDPDGQFCVGRTHDRPGWCAPGPVYFGGGDCWEDADCGGGGVACRGAAPCPPGRRCRAGGQHSGFCMAFPGQDFVNDAGRLAVTYTGNSAGDPEGLAVIRNGLPVAIVVAACGTLALETAQDAQWPENPVYTGFMDDALCGTSSTVLRIPAGGTRTLRGLQNTAPLGSFKRFALEYRMGCDGLPPTSNCQVANRVFDSAAFQ